MCEDGQLYYLSAPASITVVTSNSLNLLTVVTDHSAQTFQSLYFPFTSSASLSLRPEGNRFSCCVNINLDNHLFCTNSFLTTTLILMSEHYNLIF